MLYQENAAAPGRQKVSSMGAPPLGDVRCSTVLSTVRMQVEAFGLCFLQGSGFAHFFQLGQENRQKSKQRQI